MWNFRLCSHTQYTKYHTSLNMVHIAKDSQLQFTITFPAIYFLKHICIDIVVVSQWYCYFVRLIFHTKCGKIFVSRAYTHIFHIFLFDRNETIIFYSVFFFFCEMIVNTLDSDSIQINRTHCSKNEIYEIFFFLYHPVSIRDCLYQVSREIHDLYCVLWVAMCYFTSGFLFSCCCCFR